MNCLYFTLTCAEYMFLNIPLCHQHTLPLTCEWCTWNVRNRPAICLHHLPTVQGCAMDNATPSAVCFRRLHLQKFKNIYSTITFENKNHIKKFLIMQTQDITHLVTSTTHTHPVQLSTHACTHTRARGCHTPASTYLGMASARVWTHTSFH